MEILVLEKSYTGGGWGRGGRLGPEIFCYSILISESFDICKRKMRQTLQSVRMKNDRISKTKKRNRPPTYSRGAKKSVLILHRMK